MSGGRGDKKDSLFSAASPFVLRVLRVKKAIARQFGSKR